MKIPLDTVQSPFIGPMGPMILAAAAGQLVGVWFADQAHLPDLANVPAAPTDPVNMQVLQRAAMQLTEYFAGTRQSFDLPLSTNTGTVFQRAVWQALQTIPRGSTRSYAALAQQIGKPVAVRALGSAVGRNPWSVVVPCHRVLGSDGSLTGYAGGLPRKTALLRLEGVL